MDLFKGGGAFLRGVLKVFLVASHLPVEIFLLVDYFFDAVHACDTF